jgi:Ran GTPase-activating protein 1
LAEKMSIFDRFEGKSLKLDSALDVQIWTEELKEMKPTEIRLSGNTFGVEALRAISEALGDNLKTVKCSDMFTGRLKSEIPLALEALVKALETQKSLHEVDLSDNAFGPVLSNFNLRLVLNRFND